MAYLGTAEMMEYLYGLPEQFQTMLRVNYEVVDNYRKGYRNIMVSGMGGSAIGGDILRTWVLDRCHIPVLVNRDYAVPRFIDNESLFLAVSYSGNTEETISAYQMARERGAAIVCFTGGGKLAEMAAEDGYAVINIPGGLVPRAATGYLFTPLGLVLERLGLVAGVKDELQETVIVLNALRDRLNPDIDTTANQARQIALQLKDCLPVIWGSAGIAEVAAMRWKGQINENAKSPAFFNAFPELNHNEIVGFEAPESLLSKFALILLQDKYAHERVQKRMQITRAIIQDRVKNIIEVHSEGESLLARLYSLIYIGDYASVYLALEYGINPTPVKVIDYLKKELGR